MGGYKRVDLIYFGHVFVGDIGKKKKRQGSKVLGLYFVFFAKLGSDLP